MEQIIINLTNPLDEQIILPFSVREALEVEFSPQDEELVLSVANFPKFAKLAVNEEMALIQANVSLNVAMHSFIVDIDPFSIIADMDTKTLEELDIKEQYVVNSVS